MNNNLSFSYVRIENNIDEIERKLINKLCPLLNDIHNPNKWVILKQLRKECREFAKS